MEIHHLDASLIRQAFLAGAAELDAKKDWINELNVFPVPDGDTGTNMTLTIMTAAKEVSALETSDLRSLCKAISTGSLRGARGNSGVILSQLLRGFTKELDGAEDQIGVAKLAAAFERGTETAYKAVMKPKEGTILTVARAMSEKALALADEEMDVLRFAEQVIAAGDEALLRTPELLPVLKQAGVVDSGGQGLMTVMKGALRGLTGEGAELHFDAAPAESAETAHPRVDTAALETSDIKFGYCTEFIINLNAPMSESEEKSFQAFLESIGDSIVCVASDDIVKIHVHTNDPGLAIQKGLSYGSLSRMKIDNMREEHNERLIRNASEIAAEEKQKKAAEAAAKANAERKAYGFVCVSAGEGLDRIFHEIGVDVTISGGQTMNPSTEDILNAIDGVNADTVFVLPNNKNIILASEQARDLAQGKEVLVIPTKTIPQGISALIGFMPDLDAKQNFLAMQEAMEALRNAEITHAVRDTSIDGFEIHQGDFMAIGDQGMLAVKKTLTDAVLEAIRRISEEDTELITLYYGAEVEASEAEQLKRLASQQFPNAEVELNYGGQPVYYYFISAE